MNEYLVQLLSLAFVWGLGVMLPGPNFLVVCKTTLQDQGGPSLGVPLGISIGAVLWSCFSLLGLAFVFQRYQWLYELLKIVGGGYLVWLGVQTLRSGLNNSQTPPSDDQCAPQGRRNVWLGILTSLSNPKTAAFFVCIFATVLAPDAPLWVKVAAVCLIFTISIIWYGSLAVAFSRPWARNSYAAIKRPLTFVMGGLFMVLGGKLATSSE